MMHHSALWKWGKSTRSVGAWVSAVVSGVVFILPVLSAFGTLGGCGTAFEHAGREIPDANLVRIMPLGDSITQGSPNRDPNRYGPGTNGAYRRFLWELLQEADIAVDFVGSQTDGPGAIDADHEGHPGWQIDEISALVEEWLSAQQPRFVLLTIGTNDAFGKTVDVAIEQLETLLEQIIQGLPEDGSLLVSTIPPLGGTVSDYNDWVVVYNENVRRVVEEWSSADGRVVFVDLYVVFDEQDLYVDGVHPSESGNRKIAQAWYDALSMFLP